MAFVLGGGGVLGAVEVGMLRALFRAGIQPDLVIGTSIGAVNGALVAADPSEAVTDRLVRLWASPEASEVYGDSVARQLRRFAARTHLHSPRPLRRLLERELGEETTFADLRVPFRCCAANIERAAEHWFDSGPVVPAVLASRLRARAAAAGPDRRRALHRRRDRQLDPDRRGGRGRRRRIFVLQVGRIERPLTPAPAAVGDRAGRVRDRPAAPVRPRDGGAARRGGGARAAHRRAESPRDDTPWAYRDMAAVGRRISRAYTASRRYLRRAPAWSRGR